MRPIARRRQGGGRGGSHARGRAHGGCLAAAVAAAVSAVPASAALVQRDHLPLRTSGRYVVDRHDQRVRLQCVNWYGAHLRQMVANGLDQRPVKTIARNISELGFNCVRLPFSVEMVLGSVRTVPDADRTLRRNPELIDKTPMEVFDATVEALTNENIMVILNNHVSSSGWCCNFGDGQGLWWTKEYSEDDWVRSLRNMTERYRHDSHVVGVDLRNEIRPSSLGSPTWGGGDMVTDWSMAAVKASKEVVAANNDMLIIVSGLFYSIFLCDVPSQPIHVQHPELLGNRTVYTSHEYNWFNFHLAARSFILAYLATLAIWCTLLWGILLTAWVLQVRGYTAGGRLRACFVRVVSCGGGEARRRLLQQRINRAWGRCEVATTILLTALTVVGTALPSLVIQDCGLEGLVESIAMISVALLSGVVSLVLWMRLAFACVQRASVEIQLGGRGSIEISSLPVSIAAEEPPLSRRFPLIASQVPSVAQPAAAAPAAGVGGAAAGGPAAGGEMVFGLGPARRPTLLTVAASPKLQSMRCLVFAVTGLVLGSLGWLAHHYGKYEVFETELRTRWGFLLEKDDPNVAPVWIGEFGTDADDLWWRHTLRYIKENDVDWGYWSLNGQKSVLDAWEDETFGLLTPDFTGVRQRWKLDALQDLLRLGAADRAGDRTAGHAAGRGSLGAGGAVGAGGPGADEAAEVNSAAQDPARTPTLASTSLDVLP